MPSVGAACRTVAVVAVHHTVCAAVAAALAAVAAALAVAVAALVAVGTAAADIEQVVGTASAVVVRHLLMIVLHIQAVPVHHMTSYNIKQSATHWGEVLYCTSRQSNRNLRFSDINRVKICMCTKS